MNLTRGITATPITKKDGAWYVTDANTGKVYGPYKQFRNATLRRRAINGGTTMRNARGLPT